MGSSFKEVLNLFLTPPKRCTAIPVPGMKLNGSLESTQDLVQTMRKHNNQSHMSCRISLQQAEDHPIRLDGGKSIISSSFLPS